MTLLCWANSRLVISLEFKPQDMWIGVFWRHDTSGITEHYFDAWVCIIPMLPLHLSYLTWCPYKGGR